MRESGGGSGGGGERRGTEGPDTLAQTVVTITDNRWAECQAHSQACTNSANSNK